MKREIKAGLDSGAIIDFIYNKNLFSEYIYKIKRVYSNNNHFLDACKLFGISAIKVRTPEKEVEEQLRKMFRFHHK